MISILSSPIAEIQLAVPPAPHVVNVGSHRSRAIADWDFEITLRRFKRLKTGHCLLLEAETVDFNPMRGFFEKHHEDIALTKRSTKTMEFETVLKKMPPEVAKLQMDTLLREVGFVLLRIYSFCINPVSTVYFHTMFDKNLVIPFLAECVVAETES